jgi:hypothetical protein
MVSSAAKSSSSGCYILGAHAGLGLAPAQKREPFVVILSINDKAPYVHKNQVAI